MNVTGAPIGYAGPVAPKGDVKVYADIELEHAKGMITGGNRDGEIDLRNVDFDRDCTIAAYADITIVQDGDICAKCGKPMVVKRGIEVGHVFKLGTKYTDAFNAVYKTDELKEQVMVMGCYGIGVSRMLAAIVEQHHDEHGITWPVCVAPYEVEVVPLNVGDDLVWPEAQRVTDELSAAALEVLLDDRSERPGVKVADADLIGLPWQVILGKRGVKEGKAEVKCRATGERFDVPMDELVSWLSERIVPERA